MTSELPLLVPLLMKQCPFARWKIKFLPIEGNISLFIQQTLWALFLLNWPLANTVIVFFRDCSLYNATTKNGSSFRNAHSYQSRKPHHKVSIVPLNMFAEFLRLWIRFRAYRLIWYRQSWKDEISSGAEKVREPVKGAQGSISVTEKRSAANFIYSEN